jgi:baculoviral IAP repeat-containing protein 6
VKACCQHKQLIPLIDILPGESSSVRELIGKLSNMAKALLKTSAKAKKISSKKKKDQIEIEGEEETEEMTEEQEQEELAVANAIVEISQIVNETIKKPKEDARKKKGTEKEGKEEVDVSLPNGDDLGWRSAYVSLVSQYKEELSPLQFDECSMLDESGEHYVHHYSDRIESETTGMAPKLKRLVQEIASLSNGLPISPESSVFLRVDSDRVDVLQALITGPLGTPYSSGCFQFDIYCPNEYPKSPPVVNLETTGNGSVRFNPNLVRDGLLQSF